jgi:DNA polymerase-3 subunit epsilon
MAADPRPQVRPMHREIVLDTETTGIDPDKGDRVVEIGCVELVNHVPTGPEGHKRWYINPERLVPAEATAVHGLTDAFLSDKPVFAEVVGEFLDFVGDADLVIHNAQFDVRFLNAELARLGIPAIDHGRTVVDTLAIARRKFPGAQASLDALCKRFGVDNSGRMLHGALLDAQLLAEVYLELLGGRQRGLGLVAEAGGGDGGATGGPVRRERPYRAPRPHAPSEAELAAHAELVAKLKSPLWAAE